MPVYEYEHTGPAACPSGQRFDLQQSIKDDALDRCPACDEAVRRLISLPGIATPKTNSELKNLGFTKLVRRDSGVYENVTATGGESRYMEAGKAETMPDIKRKIED